MNLLVVWNGCPIYKNKVIRIKNGRIKHYNYIIADAEGLGIGFAKTLKGAKYIAVRSYWRTAA